MHNVRLNSILDNDFYKITMQNAGVINLKAKVRALYENNMKRD